MGSVCMAKVYSSCLHGTLTHSSRPTHAHTHTHTHTQTHTHHTHTRSSTRYRNDHTYHGRHQRGCSIAGCHAIAAGGDPSVVVKADSTVWAAGNNDNGQLGDGTATGSSVLTPARWNVLSTSSIVIPKTEVVTATLIMVVAIARFF